MATSSDALNKAVDATIAGVEKLAAAVEKVAPDAWRIMVRQQVIEGWGEIILSVVVFVVTAFLVYLSYRLFRAINWNNQDDTDLIKYFSGITVAVVCFGFFCWSISRVQDVPSNIAKIINPEYYAAQDIMRAVK